VSAAPAPETRAAAVARPELPVTRFSRWTDATLARIGELASWIWLLLIIVIVLNVTLRYAFGFGRIEFEELQWHLYSLGFLIGLSYCAQADAHIRVDVLHERFSPRVQAWIELYGILLLLLPYVALVGFYSVPFVIDSFVRGEISPSPGGLPYRWAIKSVLLIGFALLALSAVARLTRVWAFLFADTDAERTRGNVGEARVRREDS
jgi:TRAP-type mannitol/chloroaromatic compound transport system permease small subunit